MPFSAAAIPATRPTPPKAISLVPQQVIFNPPATIVYWKDGDKTVVRCDNDEFSEEFGFAMACMRKIYGTRANFKAQFKNAYYPKPKVSEEKQKKSIEHTAHTENTSAETAANHTKTGRVIKNAGEMMSLNQLLKELSNGDSFGICISTHLVDPDKI